MLPGLGCAWGWVPGILHIFLRGQAAPVLGTQRGSAGGESGAASGAACAGERRSLVPRGASGNQRVSEPVGFSQRPQFEPGDGGVQQGGEM